LDGAITNLSKYECTNPVLKPLHWLPVRRMDWFEIGLAAYKTLNIGQPQYLKSVIIPHTYSVFTLESKRGQIFTSWPIILDVYSLLMVITCFGHILWT